MIQQYVWEEQGLCERGMKKALDRHRVLNVIRRACKYKGLQSVKISYSDVTLYTDSFEKSIIY